MEVLYQLSYIGKQSSGRTVRNLLRPRPNGVEYPLIRWSQISQISLPKEVSSIAILDKFANILDFSTKACFYSLKPNTKGKPFYVKTKSSDAYLWRWHHSHSHSKRS